MTHKLLKIDGYRIVVSDEDIKINDFYYSPRTNLIYRCEEDPTELNLERQVGVSKVLLSNNPAHNLPTITFSDEVAKELGIVDVEKLAEKLSKEYSVYETAQDDVYQGIIVGYKQCLSDNADKKWSDNDLIDFHNFIFNHPNQFLRMGEYLKEYIQSLTKEEYFCEFEMIENDASYAYQFYKDDTEKQFHFHHYDSGMITFKKEFKHLYQQPKITNNSCKIIKIWK